MDEKRICGKCGVALSAYAPPGLCANCMLQQGLDPLIVPASLIEDGVAVVSDNLITTLATSTTVRYFGDYELLEEIARGGMGIVYRARQVSLDRTVAIKMLLSGPLSSPELVKRFRAEASAAASLQHPNIVAIHEVGVHQGLQYFAMDFVEGQSLAKLLANGPLPAKRAAAYLKTVAEAIHYAHECGLLHRDLKPSNVLIDSADQPRVTDFGLAKRLEGDSELTLTGQVIGSPNYMPPEQAEAKRGQLNRRSDVYALGAMLYHLLTGRPPFVGETITDTLGQVINSEPVSPRLLNPSVPRDLETLCLRCLEKEPAKRYVTAQALADELSRFLRNEPIQARPISPLEKIWRWCRRKPGLTSLGAATVLLLLTLAIGSPVAALRINRERQRAEENLYVADMHGAETALEDGDLGRAKELLEAHWPRAGQIGSRDFEWRLLCRRCRGDDLYALRGYSNFLNALNFSPDGNTLATRTGDNHLKVWDLTIRKERFTITNVTTLGGFTSDGQKFFYGTGDGSVILCEASTGRTVHSLEKAGELVRLFSDGKTIATTSREFIVKLWNITSGRETFVLPGKGGINLWGPEFGAGVVITPDGKRLAISNGFRKGITLWNLATSEILNGSLDQRQTPLTFLELSPDGKVLAIGSFDGLVRLWAMATGDELLPAIQAHSEPVISAAFSPDGQVLATASLDQTIKLWEFATRRELDTLKGHENGVLTVTFSADGKRLASGGQDKTVRLWNPRRKPVKESLSGLVETGHPLIWSPDNTLLAGDCQDKSVKLWDAATLETRDVLEGGSRVLTFSADGKTVLLCCTNGTVKYRDVATGKVLQEGPMPLLDNWNSVAISPNKRSAAIADQTPIVRLWDIASGRIDSLTGHTRSAAAVTFSPNGRTLISGGIDGDIDIWEVAQRKWVVSFEAHSARVFSVAISPDGATLASGGSDNTIKLWNLKTRSWLATLNGHRRPVWALAFSPDGRTLASGSGDHSVRLWNVSCRREVAILRRFTSNNPSVPQELRSLSFSPDGNNLAGVTSAGDLILFRAATPDEVSLRADASHVPPNSVP